MDTNNIRNRYLTLQEELKDAVSRMERTDRVFAIRDAIKDLQTLCPHSNGNYDFSTNEECPYCGKKFGE